MTNIEKRELVASLTAQEQRLLVKGLDNPINTIPSHRDKYVSLGLASLESGLLHLTGVGAELATFIQVSFDVADGVDPHDDLSEHWQITFEVTLLRFQRPPTTFREQLRVDDVVEARAVSTGHATMRGRYPHATSIRAVSRVKYELPSDMDAVEFLIPVDSSSSSS